MTVELIKALNKAKNEVRKEFYRISNTHVKTESELAEDIKTNEGGLTDSAEVIADLYEAIEELGNAIAEIAESVDPDIELTSEEE